MTHSGFCAVYQSFAPHDGACSPQCPDDDPDLELIDGHTARCHADRARFGWTLCHWSCVLARNVSVPALRQRLLGMVRP